MNQSSINQDFSRLSIDEHRTTPSTPDLTSDLYLTNIKVNEKETDTTPPSPSISDHSTDLYLINIKRDDKDTSAGPVPSVMSTSPSFSDEVKTHVKNTDVGPGPNTKSAVKSTSNAHELDSNMTGVESSPIAPSASKSTSDPVKFDAKPVGGKKAGPLLIAGKRAPTLAEMGSSGRANKANPFLIGGKPAPSLAEMGSSGSASRNITVDDRAPLQRRAQTELGWADCGDTVGISINSLTGSHVKTYRIPKRILFSESTYLKSCFATSKDPYPETTLRLAYPTAEDAYAFNFVLHWFGMCKKIPSGLAFAEEQPQISVKEWAEGVQSISYEQFAHIYCLVEVLHMPRLDEHVRAAVQIKAMDTKTLASLKAIRYTYKRGTRFSGLKNTFVDMYGIAAFNSDDVFKKAKSLFPVEFVDDVLSYSKPDAFIRRRRALLDCERVDTNVVNHDSDEETETTSEAMSSVFEDETVRS